MRWKVFEWYCYWSNVAFLFEEAEGYELHNIRNVAIVSIIESKAWLIFRGNSL